MLTFEEKLAIIESFPELERKDVSMGRVNFHYNESSYDQKNVVYHLHPNGNGFVYAGRMTGYQTNDKGMVNIRDFSEKAIRSTVRKSILSLTPKAPDKPLEDVEEIWINQNGMTLTLINEGTQWNVYADDQLDGTFNSYREAAEILDEEGFSRI
ncbi:hypothetical protein [Salisediminibacterium beveridgei]|uniref:Uncharacterized protein n=1 Tax=Salisediminibacterium beveridgei TaxID=632773 RepID=A0A1D7QXC5_9BACI|nr:hypothetical protein [Salisediminibacterium beveridgei]AOM83660.1 hypothetical protein BBEV_2319 [Salisediminibacterium beveridgei]